MPPLESAPTDLQYLPPSSPIRMFTSASQPADQAGLGFRGNTTSLQDAVDRMFAVFASVVLFYARLIFWTYAWISFLDKEVGRVSPEAEILVCILAFFWTVFCHGYHVPLGFFFETPSNPSCYLRSVQFKTSEIFATFVGSLKQKMPTWTAFNPFQRDDILLTEILALRRELSEDKAARADYEQQVTQRMHRFMTYLEANNDLVQRVTWSLEKLAQMLWDGMEEVQEAKERVAEGEAKWEAERVLFTQRELGHVETIKGLKEALQLREVQLGKERASLAEERRQAASQQQDLIEVKAASAQQKDNIALLQRENEVMKESLRGALTVFASFSDDGSDAGHLFGPEPFIRLES
ncbi:unnamed protein product [Cyclocybe aegerita]|uniref:Uncharacterized protein n=1 Tax=Cyclocybe aegerita TaxID=1973307 RepID=A0A8S0W4T7_CYCAE|nr:unnamed protein product [Cyclocybe aegerita]